MARKKKITTKNAAAGCGDVKVVLTKNYTYPNGVVLRAGKTPTVTKEFYNELLAGGYLDQPKPQPKNKD